jgi:hypothetical protein
MIAYSDPTAPTTFFQALEPPPTARPIGATAEDTDVAVFASTDQGLIEVHMPLAFAKHLICQLQDAARGAENPNRPTRQPY